MIGLQKLHYVASNCVALLSFNFRQVFKSVQL